MKILAFAASNSKNSINKQLVTHAAEVFKSEVNSTSEIEVLDLNDYELPIFSIDRENDSGIPALAQAFYDKIGASDALIISFAEHNGNYTAAFKNIFDWASRISAKVYQDKSAVFLSTSPGGRGGASALGIATQGAPHQGADLKADLSIGGFGQKFDNGAIVDKETADALRDALKMLVKN